MDDTTKLKDCITKTVNLPDHSRWICFRCPDTGLAIIGATGEAWRVCGSEEPDRPGWDQISLGVMFGYRHDDLNRFNRPVRTRMPGGVGGDRPVTGRPYPDFTVINPH